MSINLIYFLVPIIMLSFFSVMVIIGRNLRKKLKADLKKKREIKIHTSKSSVDEYIKRSEFQALKDEFEISNKIAKLHSKDFEQAKLKISSLEESVTAATALVLKSHIIRSTHHGHRDYSAIPRVEVYEYNNGLLGKSNEIAAKYKSSSKKNHTLGKQTKISSLQK